MVEQVLGLRQELALTEEQVIQVKGLHVAMAILTPDQRPRAAQLLKTLPETVKVPAALRASSRTSSWSEFSPNVSGWP